MKKQSILRAAAYPGLLGLGAAFLCGIEKAAADQPNLNQIKNEIRAAANSSGTRDAFWNRVPDGGSCVEASEARAQDIANRLQGMSDNGQLGDYTAIVGTKSGYGVGIGDYGGSIHTYTVVEIRDASGNIVKTWTVDNYLGPTSIWSWWSTDWESGWSDRRHTVGGARDTAQTTTRTATRPPGTKPPMPHAHTPKPPKLPPVHAHQHH